MKTMMALAVSTLIGSGIALAEDTNLRLSKQLEQQEQAQAQERSQLQKLDTKAKTTEKSAARTQQTGEKAEKNAFLGKAGSHPKDGGGKGETADASGLA